MGNANQYQGNKSDVVKFELGGLANHLTIFETKVVPCSEPDSVLAPSFFSYGYQRKY